MQTTSKHCFNWVENVNILEFHYNTFYSDLEDFNLHTNGHKKIWLVSSYMYTQREWPFQNHSVPEDSKLANLISYSN